MSHLVGQEMTHWLGRNNSWRGFPCRSWRWFKGTRPVLERWTPQCVGRQRVSLERRGYLLLISGARSECLKLKRPTGAWLGFSGETSFYEFQETPSLLTHAGVVSWVKRHVGPRNKGGTQTGLTIRAASRSEGA